MARQLLLSLMIVLALSACQTIAENPVRTEQQVDLNRFMGDWYVIANIPTFIERDAHNAVETYELVNSREVATTFRFRQHKFDGPVKKYTPTGYVRDAGNAVWDMQFVWPFKAEYRIMYVNQDYTQTIIGRSKRDYAWVMARSPKIPENDYQHMLDLLAREGYDVEKIQVVPQRWPEEDGAGAISGN